MLFRSKGFVKKRDNIYGSFKEVADKKNDRGKVIKIELKGGGRAGYSVGGKAVRGVSKILLKK